MGEKTMDLAADHAVEAILREELVREARALAAVAPVLRHLLGTEAQSLLSDAILARVRGMMGDLASQLLAIGAGRDPATRGGAAADPAALDALAARLMADEGLLAFCHAAATEGLIAQRLHQRHAIDPVLSPLLQELIASEDPAIAALAMTTLAAQSRFVQGQRRMELPLGELPAELFHRVTAMARSEGEETAAFSRAHAAYDEAASRIGLLARLVAAMRRGVLAGLGLEHAGLALFSSALAAATRQPRSLCVLACHEGQGMGLALRLRAAGLSPAAIERQLSLTDTAARLPRAFAEVSSDRAAVLLATGGRV
ncbi:MAG: hypothetical protein EDM03_01135 [Porphyrobacter sp. IPPAS B-1204]|nr:MAG: hypothetical protein EDM03_01135 [Porphyrobacter sp. IPPAS B-1204]